VEHNIIQISGAVLLEGRVVKMQLHNSQYKYYGCCL
jgi:hypothetical protein